MGTTGSKKRILSAAGLSVSGLVSDTIHDRNQQLNDIRVSTNDTKYKKQIEKEQKQNFEMDKKIAIANMARDLSMGHFEGLAAAKDITSSFDKYQKKLDKQSQKNHYDKNKRDGLSPFLYDSKNKKI